MKAALVIFTSVGLVLGAMAAQAGEAPGKQMKSESGPGASEYAPPNTDNDSMPGQQMKKDTGPGASTYAPGQDTDDTNKPSSSE
jgi:hypothetical protein